MNGGRLSELTASGPVRHVLLHEELHFFQITEAVAKSN